MIVVVAVHAALKQDVEARQWPFYAQNYGTDGNIIWIG
jgi:hypothetical protein